MSGDRALGRVEEKARVLEERSSTVVGRVGCVHDGFVGWLIVGG